MGGIVRRPRRPPGWTAPGPAPNPPADAAHLGPHDGEDLCFLSGDWRILQRVDGHRWSLDDLATAWVALHAVKNRTPRCHLDLGCGIGTVLLLLAWRFPALNGVGIEAQAVSVDLARRSVAWNGVEHRLRLIHGDLREQTLLPPDTRFDLVTGTPPYLPIGTATASTRPQVAPAHLETRGGIEAYCAAARRYLAPDGTVVICAAGAHVDRVGHAAADAGLRVVERLDVVPRAGKACLFAVYTLRSTGQAPAAVHTLTVRDVGGQRTAACRAMRADMGLPP